MAKQGDLTLVASKVEAAHEAYLYAGKDLNVLAAQDSDYSLYDKKKKGSFGAKKTKRDEVTDVRNIGSEIKAGGDITLKSEGDQTYQAAKLTSGKDLTLDSGGDITFEAVKDLHQESHEKSSNSLAWTSMKGKGNTDETLRQSELVAQGQLAIQAANKIHIDVKDINAQTVSQTVDAMVKADPNLAWIKQAEAQGDIDWRQVKEIHDSFKYSHSGLGQGAMLAVIIVVTVLTAGAASAAVGAAAGATAGSGTAMAAAGTVTTAATATTAATTTAVAAGWANVAATAALTSMASSGAVSLINNRGNIGATLKDTLSSDGLKNAMIAAGTAGFMSYAGSNWFKTTVDPVSGKVTGAIPDLTNPGNFARFAQTQLLQGAVKGTLSEALGQGKFSDSLKGSVFSILQAAAFNQVGDLGKQWHLEDSGLGKTAMHAVVGGLLSEAMGGDFKTGAVAAGANEALIETLDKSPLLAGADQSQHQRLVNMASQLVGLVAAASVGGNVQQGAEIAGNAQAYNRQLHSFERQILDEKAQELQQTLGNTKSGESWETLLTLVGGAAVDSEDSQKLAALQASLKDSNPESWSLKQDLMQAQQVIDQLKSQRIALTWSNGNPIVADGDRVYAFAATDAQRQDHALFDVASNTGLYNAPGNDPVVPDKYVQQFGDYVAAKHQSEIASVSSDTLSKNDQWEALQGRTNSGLVDVTFADALGALPAGRAVRAGTALSTTLQATAREAEESIAGGLAKAVSQDTSRTGVPQWTVAAEDTYGARLAGSYKVGDTAYNGAAVSDSAYGFGSLLDKATTPAVDVGSTFSQQRSFWKDVVQFDGNRVYQRDDLFDPDFVSNWREGGKVVTGTNVERMASGRAPIGMDGKSINLHHTTQTQSGPIAEMTQTFHQQNSSTIHINPNTIPSGIDRASFDKWKTNYWQKRAADYGGTQ